MVLGALTVTEDEQKAQQRTLDKIREYCEEADDETILTLEPTMEALREQNPLAYKFMKLVWEERLAKAKNRN